jgi:hypothetical protein
MLLHKKSYYQGTENPKPKKQQYKPEKAIVVQPRFKEPFYKNYDLYETEGVSGPAKHGPGSGFYQNIKNYKSVSDFLKKKRENNKGKYKSDEQKKRSRKKKMANRRIQILASITKVAIDFPSDALFTLIDDVENDNPLHDAAPIGGLRGGEYVPSPDLKGGLPHSLDFGRYDENPERLPEETEQDIWTSPEEIDEYSKVGEELEGPAEEENIKKNIRPAAPSIYGLPDGILPEEDLDAVNHVSNTNPYFGTLNNGNTMYDKMWF